MINNEDYRKFIEMIDKTFSVMKKDERNDLLREQIFTYAASQVLTDDERAKLLNLPEGCRIRENAKIISPENFKCGRNVWIGEGAILDASGGLEVGDHTSVGLYVMLWSHSSYLTNLAMANYSGSDLIERKPTKIGKGCFIAGHSVVYHGVTVGDRTVVLPMTVITKDIKGNCIVGGSPAKVIRELSDDYIDALMKKTNSKH
jgi:acetyltransferase-like isoleucine patch superfamily enzyme